MEYQGFNLRRVKRATLLTYLRAGLLPKLDKAEWKHWQEVVLAAMRRREALLAGNALLLGLYLDHTGVFIFLRKRGILRYYSYAPGRSIVAEIAAELLTELPRVTGARREDRDYLQSVANLTNLHHALTGLHTTIGKEVDRFHRRYPGKSLIKTLLAFAESLFMFGYEPTMSPSTPGLAGKSKEAVAEAVSFLTYYLTQHRPTAAQSSHFISEEYILHGRIEVMLTAACTLDELKELEIMVADFGYLCVRQGGRLRLLPPSEALARSIKLGYIRTEQQAYIDNQKHKPIGPSLHELVQQLLDTQQVVQFERTSSLGYERYAMSIHEALYDEVVQQLLTRDVVFDEEIRYVSHIFKEQLLTPADLDTIQLRPHLSLYDFVRINRIFHLLHAFFFKRLSTESEANPALVYRSLVPTFTPTKFARLLGSSFPPDKTAAYLDLISWQPEREYIFDLQYHPAVLLDSGVLLSIAVLVRSNAIRNAFASERKRNNQGLNTNGTDDVLVAGLVAAFKQAGIPCYANTKVPGSDLDLLVIWDDTLFFFECKHSLLPVSAFDLRTTHDYVRKAEQQLDHINQLYASGQLLPYLANRYKVDLSRIKRTVSGIVLSNRMLNGNAFRYPVRHVHELVTLLTWGRFRTNQGTFRQWRGEHLALEDLIDYFNLQNKLVTLLHQSLSVETQTITVSPLRVEQDDYFWDVQQVQALLATYTATLVRESEPNEEPNPSALQ